MSIFITGTDTGVGKTHGAAALLLRYAEKKVSYWKPVQTGKEENDRTTVMELTDLPEELFFPLFRHYTLPLSPHRAAEEDGEPLDEAELLKRARELLAKGPVVLEGAGGLFVPLTRRFTWIDFVTELHLPVVVVARTGLGTINHTMLTLEVLRYNQIPVAGILFCGEENEDNMATIQQFSGIPSLGRFYFEGAPSGPLKKGSADHLDPEGILAPYL